MMSGGGEKASWVKEEKEEKEQDRMRARIGGESEGLAAGDTKST
jgi:hypothetical protein